MKESEFIKLNLKFEISNVCTNIKVKITNLRTAVRQLANTLTVREFKKRIIHCVWTSFYQQRLRHERTLDTTSLLFQSKLTSSNSKKILVIIF
jgi:hypothetical protein